jgi:enediyne biosynthesis protein E4
MARIKKIIPIHLFISVCLFCVCCGDKNTTRNENTLFEMMSSKETGISFNNVVKDTRDLNIFNFRNFYNGAGVAIGDINNDGLADVFFTANQGENKLYLNKGNFKFEDITAKAGFKNEAKWYTGVTMADINGDGWLDIYICNSGKPGSNKPNDLYINQRNGTFKEEAKKYGLDDKGLSTHAAFFDYDHDGDLDCFVLNNSSRSIESFGYKSVRHIRDTLNGDRLYRNDKGKFIDVSKQAGIYGSEIGFGLGITVGDVNNDGWEDIYISNDFFEKDYLYINQQDGKFSEVINNSMGHISQGSMGADMIDINNDGWLDIFTTEMLPEDDYTLKTTTRFDDYDVNNARLKNDFHHQYSANCLQLNNGDGTFSEIAQLAGVDATNWSWGGLSFDFDNDGLKDLFVCNGISKDLTDQDFLEFFGSEEVLNKVKSGGFKFDDILSKMPSNKIPNYAFINKGNLQFKNSTDSLGFSTRSFSNGAAYGDLDNDGDLDLIINNENIEAFVYRNKAAEQTGNHYLKIKLQGDSLNRYGIGARVSVYTKSGMQVLEQMPSRGFQSSVENILHFGLGKTNAVDSLIIKWPNNKYQLIKNIQSNTTITLFQASANLPIPYVGGVAPPVGNLNLKTYSGGAGVGFFTQIPSPPSATHHENPFIDFDVERLIPKMLSTEGPAIAVADINNDGLEDFFLGNAISDTAKIFIQQKNGTFKLKPQPSFAEDKYFETTAAVFFDINNDNNKDLILVSGGNQAQLGSPYLNIRLYINDRHSNFTRDTTILPDISVNASCIVICDIDNDGKEDIFIGARSVPGKYGISPSSVLLKNEGHGKFNDISFSSPVLKNMGMVTDAKFADVNNDGKKELIIAGDWQPITAFNYINGSLQKTLQIPHSSGWWNCIEVNDIDDDGDMDIIAGNTGLNSRIKASPDKPAKLYVGDFDKNGQIECLPVYFKSDGKAYPYFMKGELQQQIPSLKKDFLYYADYAGKSIEKVFSKEQLKDIDILNVEETRTCMYKNDGKGNFIMQALPLMSQLSTTNAIYIDDIDRDGKKDIIMAGNFYGLKPQMGRFDASYGTTLLANATGGYDYIPSKQSGFFINGEARDIKPISPNIILVGMNNEEVYLFKK